MATTVDLRKEAEQAEAAYRQRSRADPLLFIRGLMIPSDRGGKYGELFADCIAPFQFAALEDLCPALLAVQRGEMPPIRRHWWERTKKSSKDGDIAACLLWLVAFAERPLLVQVAAADREQAAIVKDRLTALLFHNPWLEEYVESQSFLIKSLNSPARLEIIASDTAGSHGATPDVLVINELSHITKWEFVGNLIDNALGVPRGLVVIATNAGFKGSRPEVYRNIAMERNSGWAVHIWDKPAPWHTPETLEEARKMAGTPSRYRRLWHGKWASGKGDALDDAKLDRLFVPGLRPLAGPQSGWVYIMGLDLGISHDHAGAVVTGINVTQRKLRIAECRGWEPAKKTCEVDLIAVREWVLARSKLFRAVWVGYDPAQAVLMAQELRLKHVPMQPVPFAGKGLTDMAETLVTVVNDGILQCYEDHEGRLRRDLAKFNVVEKSYGYKLEAVSDEFGHADVGTALVITLPKAVALLNGLSYGLGEEDEVAYANSSPMEREEVEAMPDELRDIYESCGPLPEERHHLGRYRQDD